MGASQLSGDVDCFAKREPLEIYLACTDYVSSSMLRRLEQPAMARFDGSSMGEALHAFLLEPEEFARRYLVLDGSVPAGATLTESEVMARVWLSPGQHAALRWAREAIDRYAQAPLARWFGEGEKELSIYWRDAAGGRWKARPDCFLPEIILELKTTGDVRPDAFAAVRERLGYDLQAAHYVEAVERLTGCRPRFAFVALELFEPRSLWLHELTDAELERARYRLDAARRAYAQLRAAQR
jgi:hypothetical protein